jgi:CspA family cold shock protein
MRAREARLSIFLQAVMNVVLTSPATDTGALGSLSLSSLTEAGMHHVGACPHYGTRIPKMITGTVKFFNADKGYGFIAPEDGGNDAFVHISAVERAGLRTLNKDQRVSYELEADRGGKQSAVNIQTV